MPPPPSEPTAEAFAGAFAGVPGDTELFCWLYVVLAVLGAQVLPGVWVETPGTDEVALVVPVVPALSPAAIAGAIARGSPARAANIKGLKAFIDHLLYYNRDGLMPNRVTGS